MSKIILKDVYLDYPITGKINRSVKNRILDILTGGVVSEGNGVPIVHALRGMSMEIHEGDRVALVGHNGAGKSTLLKVLAGIYPVSRGEVITEGRIVSTLNLQLGMEYEASGIENIIARGLILGMKRHEIDARLEEICAFTGLGEYLGMPVRVYSYGMAMRLAFSTVTAMDADILLMDEVIGSGDAAFKEKAEMRLKDFLRRTKILVMTSHDEGTVRKFCNKAVVLDHGKIVGFGAVEEMLSYYNERVMGKHA